MSSNPIHSTNIREQTRQQIQAYRLSRTPQSLISIGVGGLGAYSSPYAPTSAAAEFYRGGANNSQDSFKSDKASTNNVTRSALEEDATKAADSFTRKASTEKLKP